MKTSIIAIVIMIFMCSCDTESYDLSCMKAPVKIIGIKHIDTNYLNYSIVTVIDGNGTVKTFEGNLAKTLSSRKINDIIK